MADHILINRCQICNYPTHEIIALGDIPLVDGLIDPAHAHEPVVKYPAPLVFCPECTLVQLGCIVDPKLLFPLDYPYTSSTTSVLRHNFRELAEESAQFTTLSPNDLVIDIGCNDGNLLANFKDRAKVLGITPENMGNVARQKGINVIQSYFTPQITQAILSGYGQAKMITATNVLAHFKNVHEAMECIKQLLRPDGIFISESGYFFSMLEELQYDSIHHEHLRYYTLTTLDVLFKKHGLEIIHAKHIPTHGGSIRVYAARTGTHKVRPTVEELRQTEQNKNLGKKVLDEFRLRIIENKSSLHKLLTEVKQTGKTIAGISAPGRATALLNYAGITKELMSETMEITGSQKIGKIIPGTGILIAPETELYKKAPDYALILSWHFAQELMPKIKAKGFQGDFILPLPTAKIIRNAEVS